MTLVLLLASLSSFVSIACYHSPPLKPYSLDARLACFSMLRNFGLYHYYIHFSFLILMIFSPVSRTSWWLSSVAIKASNAVSDPKASYNTVIFWIYHHYTYYSSVASLMTGGWVLLRGLVLAARNHYFTISFLRSILRTTARAKCPL